MENRLVKGGSTSFPQRQLYDQSTDAMANEEDGARPVLPYVLVCKRIVKRPASDINSPALDESPALLLASLRPKRSASSSGAATRLTIA